jgi:hypothetical protein
MRKIKFIAYWVGEPPPNAPRSISAAGAKEFSKKRRLLHYKEQTAFLYVKRKPLVLRFTPDV